MSFDEISLEQAAENIYNQETKEHFSEVLRCYSGGCYRSSVVILWTVTVFDLLKKVDELSTLFEDTTAEALLRELRTMWDAEPHSPAWESVLVEKMRNPLRFLEVADVSLLNGLKQLRHLCAHPALNTNFELFQPTRDMARAYIRNSLEMILLKPPVLSAKVTSQVLRDLSAHKDAFPTDKDLEQFLQARYLRNLPAREIQTIFRTIWKLVFRSEDADCCENRKINFRTLKLLFTRHAASLQEGLKKESSFYSKISGEPEIIQNLIIFLSEHPKVYPLLDTDAQIIIRAACEKNADMLCRAWFLQGDGSIRSHLEAIGPKIGFVLMEGGDISTFKIDFVPSARTYSDLVEAAKRQGELNLCLMVGLNYYTGAVSYSDADSSFPLFLEPYLSLMTQEVLVELMNGIEKNNQTYGRGRSGKQHLQIFERARTFFTEESLLEQYPKFMNSIERD